MENYPVKNFASSYIYSKPIYEKPLMDAIINAQRLDVSGEPFSNIIMDVKRRQETVILSDILVSKNVELLICAKPLPDAFSVFCAKDVASEDRRLKVFIDCTSIIKEKNGFYICDRLDVLIAYLISALANMLYNAEPRRIVTNNALVTSATDCFVSMFSYVLDYLRLNGVVENKNKLYYLIAMYFQNSVLLKPISDSVRNISIKLADISIREANMLDILYDPANDFVNINTFITKLVDLFKFKGLTIDVFIERWRYLFGRGTQFGPELFTSFSTIITNAYCGCYLNQQKTIEKCIGKEMVTYTTTLFKIGNDAMNKKY